MPSSAAARAQVAAKLPSSAPLEQAATRGPGMRELLSDVGGVQVVNGIVGFLFAATAPVAIILAVGTKAKLSPGDLSSWIFGSFFLNGLLSLWFCWRYRQPLVFFWTIPGVVLVGPALAHLTFPQVIGAYYATGVLMAVLGWSGVVRRVMQAVPVPIVMAMVAGVFLRFGLGLVFAVRDDFWIAAPMVVAFLVLSALPALRRVPPLIGTLVVGAVLVAVLGRFAGISSETADLVRPNLYVPAFSWQAMVELVLPLAITVLVVQNGQGITVLRAAGHEPPYDAVTVACGIGSIASAAVGAVSTCLTGPVNAILAASGEKSKQYSAGLVVGVLALAFGLFAPVFTSLMLATPKAFIATLAGLAMLRVLQTAFVVSFKERFTLGALVTFLVTVGDVPILNIGAPSWALVFGVIVSLLLERGDFRATKPA